MGITGVVVKGVLISLLASSSTVGTWWRGRSVEAEEKIQKGGLNLCEMHLEGAFLSLRAFRPAIKQLAGGGEAYHLIFRDEGEVADVLYIYQKDAQRPTVRVDSLPKGWRAIYTHSKPGEAHSAALVLQADYGCYYWFDVETPLGISAHAVNGEQGDSRSL